MMSFSRAHKFSEYDELDMKKLEAEFEGIARFLNVSVIPNLEKVVKQEKIQTGTTGEPSNPDSEGQHGGIDKLVRYRSAMLSSVAQVAQENLYPIIGMKKTLTKDDIDAGVLVGSVPQGYTIKRFYWDIKEGFEDNKIKINDGEKDIVANGEDGSFQMVDLSIENLGDAPMNYEYLSPAVLTATIEGTESETGEVELIFDLQKIQRV